MAGNLLERTPVSVHLHASLWLGCAALNTLMHRAIATPSYPTVIGEMKWARRELLRMYIHYWTPLAELAQQFLRLQYNACFGSEFFLPLWVSLNLQAVFYKQKPSAWTTLIAKSYTWISKCTLFSIDYWHYTVKLLMLACILCHCIHC